MRRTLPILASILLGALAVALGMGIYLQKANDDRERLAAIARRAQDQVEQIKIEGRQAIEQANKKVAAADVEIAKAQNLVKQMEEDRTFLTQATTLIAPNAKMLRTWKDALNLPLGVSLKYPPQAVLDTNDVQSLILVQAPQSGQLITEDARWLSITPYDARLEQELTLNLVSSTEVMYTVRGRLLKGVRGILPGRSGTFTIVRIRGGGKNTHLIWGREPISETTKVPLTDILATLDFPQ